MLVMPVGVASRGVSTSFSTTKTPSFKSYDWSQYENHDGRPIPDIEMKKYNLSREAESLEKAGKIAEAAEKWFDVAALCRNGGKERDAYLCETTARKLLKLLHK